MFCCKCISTVNLDKREDQHCRYCGQHLLVAETVSGHVIASFDVNGYERCRTYVDEKKKLSKLIKFPSMQKPLISRHRLLELTNIRGRVPSSRNRVPKSDTIRLQNRRLSLYGGQPCRRP